MIDSEDVVMYSLLAMIAVFTIAMSLSIIGGLIWGGYCFFGDVEDLRYQYLCGISADIK